MQTTLKEINGLFKFLFLMRASSSYGISNCSLSATYFVTLSFTQFSKCSDVRRLHCELNIAFYERIF